MLTPKDIETKEFGKAKVGGYKPEDVDDFLDAIYSDYSRILSEKEALTKKVIASMRRSRSTSPNRISISFHRSTPRRAVTMSWQTPAKRQISSFSMLRIMQRNLLKPPNRRLNISRR